MATTVDEYYIRLGIDPKPGQGIETTIKQVVELTRLLEGMGMSATEVEAQIQKLLSAANKDKVGAGAKPRFIDSSGSLTDLGKQVAAEARRRSDEKKQADAEKAKRDEEKRKRQQELEESRKFAAAHRRLMAYQNIANPFQFISPTSGFKIAGFTMALGRAVPKLQALSFFFRAASGVWEFGAAMAKINTQILKLSESSNLGAQNLVNLGAAVKAFGGSVESIAQGNERFVMQMERMKRGGGMGYLADVAYKYGFSVDMNADWAKNTQSAIDHAREMIASGDETGAMAFLKEWDSANYTSNMMRARMSKGEESEYMQYFKDWDNSGDVEKATEATKEFNIETAKAARAWQAVTNEIAATLLPVMSKLVSWVRGLAETLAKHPTMLKAIIIAITGIVGGLLAIKAVLGVIAAIKAGIAIMSGHWAAAAAGLAVIAGAGVMIGAMGSGGEANKNTRKIEAVTENGIKLSDWSKNNGILPAQSHYLINNQFNSLVDKAAQKGTADKALFKNAVWGTAEIRERRLGDGLDGETNEKKTFWGTTVSSVVEGFNKVAVAAVDTAEAMRNSAKEAMSFQEAMELQKAMIDAQKAERSANSEVNNSNSQKVDVKIENHIAGADAEAIDHLQNQNTNDIAEQIEKTAHTWNARE